MTLYFFVGSEFSSDTDFLALNQGAAQIKSNEQKIIFLSAWDTSLDAIAKSLQPGDVIIGASAGGGAAASLAKKIIALGKPKPIIIGFEALGGLEEIDGVISITQADNPKAIHYDNHFMYQLQDDTHELINGRKRYVYGHAFYAVHPSFVGRLQYSKNTLTRIGNSDYVIIPAASLTVGSKTFAYKNLIAKTTSTQSLELDAVGSRVFQIDLIHNISISSKQNTLDKDEIIPGLRLTSTGSPKKKLVEAHSENSVPDLLEPEINISTHNTSVTEPAKELKTKSNGKDLHKIAEQLVELVKEYKNNSSSERAPQFHDEIMETLNPHSTLSYESKIRNFYLYFTKTTEREGVLISNMDYMKKMDPSKSMLRFFSGIAAVVLMILTFPVSIPLALIIHKKTGRNPLDLFNTHVAQFSKEIELIKKKKLSLNFFSTQQTSTAGDENQGEPENSLVAP